MRLFHPFLPLHPLLPGAMHGDGAAGLKKRRGTRFPIHTSAPGKCLLAFCSKAERENEPRIAALAGAVVEAGRIAAKTLRGVKVR